MTVSKPLSPFPANFEQAALKCEQTECLCVTAEPWTRLPDIRPPSCHSSAPSERNTRIFRRAAGTWTRCLNSARESSLRPNTRRTPPPPWTDLLCSPFATEEAPWRAYSAGYLSSAISCLASVVFRSTTFGRLRLVDGGPRRRANQSRKSSRTRPISAAVWAWCCCCRRCWEEVTRLLRVCTLNNGATLISLCTLT